MNNPSQNGWFGYPHDLDPPQAESPCYASSSPTSCPLQPAHGNSWLRPWAGRATGKSLPATSRSDLASQVHPWSKPILAIGLASHVTMVDVVCHSALWLVSQPDGKILYHALPCFTMLYHVLPCFTMLYHSLNRILWIYPCGGCYNIMMSLLFA